MVTHLYMSRTPSRQTNKVIYRLMRASVQTGVFCTIFAMGDLISFRKTLSWEYYSLTQSCAVALPRSYLYGMFAFPIGRIYTNVSTSHLTVGDKVSQLLDSYGQSERTGRIERRV